MDGKEQTNTLVTMLSTPEEKIALFRPLFRGRHDVYPRRFESRKTGKSGYSPACANEWVRGLCDKRKVKCVDCPNQQFLPVTDDVIRCHLSGADVNGRDFVAGVYPMLLDETCYFLAVDFDKESWRDDINAVRQTCDEFGVPSAVERSRSGNGAHVWIFFEKAIPAILARKLGAHILTVTMDRRPDVGLDSYDRFFPNQDTLPRGGLGNLIALPLQKQPRANNNTVFLDDSLIPWRDQWAFLSEVAKLSKDRLDTIVGGAERSGNIVGVRLVFDDEDSESPWLARPSRRRAAPEVQGVLPKKIEMVLGNEIFVPKGDLSPSLRNRLLRLAAFQNPEFYKAQAMRLPTFDKPRIIACAEDHPEHLALPRGCLDDLQQLLASLGIKAAIRDERFEGKALDLTFSGQLRPDQEEAALALLAHDTGVLAATTAFGKTVIAAWLIAQRGTNALVLVHRRQLLEQWVDRLSSFLDIPAKEIGRIGGGRKKPTGGLDVALIQSLVRKGVVKDIVGEYGHLVVDECHHLPAFSFEQVARRAKAKYVLGLSATVTRKDGHHPIILMQCGPIRHRVSAKEQAAERPFVHSVLVRPTSFHSHEPEEENAGIQFHRLYQALMVDEARNQQVVADVVESVREGRKPVVLTERREHLELLAEALSPVVQHLIVLKGGIGKKKLDVAMTQLATVPEDEARVVLATGRYLGEGFDDARLDTLFLTLPVSWRGTIAQYVGRLHRTHECKREVRVYDYADLNVPMLARMFDRRCKGYESVGYTILLPASAVPGWPPEVPLPVDPAWKRDYAASVQRLIRDGVDPPLGDLFVHAARTFPATVEGGTIARSSSEAFLYRRLETLPAVSGRFRLNEKLPIQFDQRGHMEVDFLCPEARLVIELDGPQHLSDVDAYRRDRQKDALLQEHGYFVLRFLAEDIGKKLDAILDTILRTLAHCERHEGRSRDGADQK
jgi:superfamily II DNA or RNA helicase/very-short-patch-repair endonuclease